MLTPYDEYPVHQYARPFSEIPTTAYSWDDGYAFQWYDTKLGVYVFTGLRVNNNAGMVGGYAGIVTTAGKQRTLRFKRPWGPDYSLRVGPFSISFTEPLRRIKLILEENDSGLSYDVDWIALAPPFEEEHRLVRPHGRILTDQTRYNQMGTAAGHVRFGNEQWDVTPERWASFRDHSWGIYSERPPLVPDAQWLRPAKPPARRRALRLLVCLSSPTTVLWFHLHEDAEGRQRDLDDVFGAGFGGDIVAAPGQPPRKLISAQHKVEFRPGTRVMSAGTVTLTDEDGRLWTLDMTPATPPWNAHTAGYHRGSWRDGGSDWTYPGTDDAVLEWDEYDVLRQPYEHRGYHGFYQPAAFGTEYACHVKGDGPGGGFVAQAFVELMVDGRYDPAGFTEHTPPNRANAAGHAPQRQTE